MFLVATDIEVILHRIWSETNNRLSTLSERVAENRSVDEAREFSNWLFWSGILELLERESCGGPLKVDGSNLRWKCKELEGQCQERYRLNDVRPHVEALQLQSIHEKLNLMAGYLSKLVVSPGAAVVTSVPGLALISGGLDEAAGLSVERNASAS